MRGGVLNEMVSPDKKARDTSNSQDLHFTKVKLNDESQSIKRKMKRKAMRCAEIKVSRPLRFGAN